VRREKFNSVSHGREDDRVIHISNCINDGGISMSEKCRIVSTWNLEKKKLRTPEINENSIFEENITVVHITLNKMEK
jgi:hypothetical protein